MGPFDYLQKKGVKTIKPQPQQIRREVVRSNSQAKPLSGSTANVPTSRRSTQSPAARPNPGSSLKSHNPNPRKRALPTQSRLESDSDDDDDGDDDEKVVQARSKRIRPNGLVMEDASRQLRNKEAFLEDANQSFPMVHAAEIASAERPSKQLSKYKAAFSADSEPAIVSLQYPSASRKEMYELVYPGQSDDFAPLEDIREVMEIIIAHYLPQEQAAALMDDSYGLIRRLKRAMNRRSLDEYQTVLSEWNGTLTRLRQEGHISRTLDTRHSLDLTLVERILTQVYSRTVSPHVHLLRQYKNGTDNVYGELLPSLISKMLKEDAHLKSNQVFVDLGSGVGNVVLQAALEVGCESWGCEQTNNACELAQLQGAEFEARCRLWGLAVGEIHLEKGDFFENAAIGAILKRADVVLVNNQAFTSDLNERLINLFLDLKEGCKIISLKSFVPTGQKITERNQYRMSNILDVTKKEYFSASVSWTDAGGNYFVSKKDSSKLHNFASKEQ